MDEGELFPFGEFDVEAPPTMGISGLVYILRWLADGVLVADCGGVGWCF